ncbi:MAG: hypothetical protein QF721_11915 [Verrucomicrobiota bacterium]|nr:hypothetical protein [Verrucomicrobiota bacterium]
MNAWKPILAAMVIFAAGFVTGNFVADHGVSKPPRAVPREHGPRGPGSRMEGQLNWLMKRIQRDLQLTDAQAVKVESAFKASREEVKTYWEEMRPRMRASTEKLKETLRGDLTEEQIAKFEKYLRAPGGRERFKGSPSGHPGFRNGKDGDKRPRRKPRSTEHPQ